MLAVESVLALDHAGMDAVAQVLTGGFQRLRHTEVRNGRVLNGGIFQRSMLITDSAGGHDHVAGQHIHGDSAAGTHPNEGVRTDVVQLLHGNGGRGSADAGGADADLLPQQGAGINVVLPVHSDMDGVIE